MAKVSLARRCLAKAEMSIEAKRFAEQRNREEGHCQAKDWHNREAMLRDAREWRGRVSRSKGTALSRCATLGKGIEVNSIALASAGNALRRFAVRWNCTGVHREVKENYVLPRDSAATKRNAKEWRRGAKDCKGVALRGYAATVNVD